MSEKSERIWWRKTGGGSLRLRINGRLKIIKPGEKFQAYPEEVPEAFRDVVIALGDLPVESQSKKSIPGISPKYILEPTKRNGFYNIVDESTGKKINEKVLNKKDATKLIEDLES